MAKYIEIEKEIETKLQEQKKYSNKYSAIEKLNNLSQPKLFQEILNFKLTSNNIDLIYLNNNQISWREIYNYISQPINSYYVTKFSEKQKSNREKFITILKHILSVSDTFIEGLDNIKIIKNIAEKTEFNEFIRPLENWKPNRRNSKLQKSSLLKHLFCKYEVPTFLENGFLGDEEAIFLYLHLGSGNSIKSYPFLPKNMILNKKVYHHLFTNPEDLNYYQGFRRAQVLSMGGNNNLFKSLIDSQLRANAGPFKSEELVFHFIEMLVNSPMFDYDKISEIVDFIAFKILNQKRDNKYTLKGKNIETLLRQSEVWHKEAFIQQRILRRQNTTNSIYGNIPKSWDGFNMKDFFIQKEKVTFKFFQLKSYNDLRIEGAEMRNCVGSYANSCASGNKTIFSLREKKINEASWKNLATIEIASSKTIVQAKGKANTKLDVSIWNHIREWADSEGLNIQSGIK